MRVRPRLVGVVVAATACLLPLAPSARADAVCGATPAPDEWPTFGRDLANSRTQSAAGDIAPTSVPAMQPAWAYSTGNAATGIADLNGTPIVSGGCVFINTAAGDVIALDADTGAQLWRTKVALDPGTSAGLGGLFVSSPAVDGGVVYALVSQVGSPYVLALDAATGAVLYRSDPIATGDGYYTNATPVVYDGMVLAGFSPAEGDPKGQGGVALVNITPPRHRHDAALGSIITTVFAIPQAKWAAGYAGAGIWTAPAVDTAHGYAYVGTGNPSSKKIEEEHSNAIIKIDVNRRSRAFGTVVGAMKGVIEQYRPELRQAVDPVCEAEGENPDLQLVVGDSAPCLQLDLDFGAPPNLFRDSSGQLLIGDLQKAGVYHAADAGSMVQKWSAIVGGTCPACNAAAWASNGAGALFGASSPVGTMLSVGDADGTPKWASPIADGTHYQSTSIAGGVVFTVDNYGNLLAWDEATGAPLLKRPVTADLPPGTQPEAALSSAGVAIAGGLVIVAAGNGVVAYRPTPLG